MDLEFLQDVQDNSHLFNHNDFDEIKKCSKCDSLFVEEGVCQTCGFNENINILGEPLGERSFYTLRERYWNSLSPFERENILFFKDEVKSKHFLNKLKLRYNDLLNYFYSKDSLNDENRPIFLQELRDLIIELKNSNVSEEEIWNPVNLEDKSSISLSLYERINEVLKECRENEETKTSFLEYKLAGRFTLANLLFGGLVLTLFISILIALFAIKNSSIS